MARNVVSVAALGDAIAQELTLYHENVVEQINAAGEKAIKRMVKLAKAGAPAATGKLQKNITYKAFDGSHGDKAYVLYAKAPSHRVFHLAVHGHATKTGGRARGNPFMANAMDAVLPEYEEDVKEAIRNG
jgi:hypothetical protein